MSTLLIVLLILLLLGGGGGWYGYNRWGTGGLGGAVTVVVSSLFILWLLGYLH